MRRPAKVAFIAVAVILVAGLALLVDTLTKGTGGFHVDAKTKYVRGTSKLTLADLKPGTRVVVTARTEGEKMIAVEVKLSGRPPAAGQAH